jgi:transposase
MTAIGIDTHKGSLACCLVDALGTPIDERTLPNDPAGHAALVAWVRSLDPVPLVGLEGSASYGAAAARALVAAGLETREVPPMLSRRERRASRRVGKSDPGDALAIARVVARERGLPPVRTEDPSTELGLLVAARDRLLAEATRVRNGVHAQLLVLLPGYAAAAPNLVAARHRRTVRGGLRGRTGVRVDLVRADLERLERLGREARALERSIAARVAGHPLLRVPGCGAITAATLLGRVGDVARIGSHDRLAMLAGVAPVPASSGQVRRVRLNRGGDRRLNRAFYTIALTQVRCHPPARAYVERKRAEGKGWAEAIRCLKRHLARVVFHALRAGAPGAAGSGLDDIGA